MEYLQPRSRKHLTANDRVRVEFLAKSGEGVVSIARKLGVSHSTISRELKRGRTEYLNSHDWVMIPYYSADLAQQQAEYAQTSKGRIEKIGNRYDYLHALEELILQNYSPETAIQVLLRQNKFDITISKNTFYRYLRLGYFSRISYSDLPVGKRRVRRGCVSRVNKHSVHHTSIENRSKEILSRSEFGHWELDSVVGKSVGKSESCLVLTERKTRLELVLKVSDKKADCTVSAMRYVRRCLGADYKKLFLTVTCDNGSEFADQKGLEAVGPVYFWCHPSCPSERGSNECANRLVRRKLPKGQSLASVTRSFASAVTAWVNNYPRRMFGFDSSLDMLRRELDSLCLSRPERAISLFGGCS
jgi:IS30 family transposase